jgi:DNA-binding MarR family transcriptional regulator
VISRQAKRLKHPNPDDLVALDLITPVVDTCSFLVLIFLILVSAKTMRNFRQSKQAVVESASLLEVIVNALTSRLEASESVVASLRQGFEHINQRSTRLEDEQSSLRGKYQQVLERLQEGLSNDRRLLLELEQLKVRLTTIPGRPPSVANTPKQTSRGPLLGSTDDPLAPLTPTERHTLEILAREGAKAAPDLGRRMRKSREHMARLMKKLYLEGYVDRESNHAPFRYKLSEKIGSLLQTDRSSTEEASQKA